MKRGGRGVGRREGEDSRGPLRCEEATDRQNVEKSKQEVMAVSQRGKKQEDKRWMEGGREGVCVCDSQ